MDRASHLWLGLSFAAALAAQTSFTLRVDTATPRLRTLTFDTDDGTLRVYLPDPLHPGDEIRGSASVERALSSALAHYKVDFAGASTVVGEFRATIPTAAKYEVLNLRNPQGRVVASAVVPVSTQPHFSMAPPNKKIPEAVQAWGTAILFGETEVTQQVLAAGPGFAVVRVPPQGLPGSRLLQVELSGVPNSLKNGKDLQARLTVSGLQGLTNPIPIQLLNETPALARFDPDTPYVWIHAQDVDRQGRFRSQPLLLRGIQPGHIRIGARVAMPGDRVDEIALILLRERGEAPIDLLRKLPYDAFPWLQELLPDYRAAQAMFELDARRAMPLALASPDYGIREMALKHLLNAYAPEFRQQALLAAIENLKANGHQIVALKTAGITGNAGTIEVLEPFTQPGRHDEVVAVALGALARLGSEPHIERLRGELAAAVGKPIRSVPEGMRLTWLLEAAGFSGKQEFVRSVCSHLWTQGFSEGDMFVAPQLAAAGALVRIEENDPLRFAIGPVEALQKACLARGAVHR